MNKTLTINSLEIPRVGLGTWKTKSGPVGEQAVLCALKAGYRHIDTAAIYGNESAVGKAIITSGIPREEIFVTTKLWNTDQKDPEGALRESLKRLGLSYVDLYLIHFPVTKTRKNAWLAMEGLLKKKLCRTIGVSNYTIAHLPELLTYATIKPVVNQVEFHPFLYQKDLLAFCEKNNIAVEAYSPLTRGEKLNDPVLKEIAAHSKKTPAQILIRWGLEHGLIVLPKSVTEERIKENIDVWDFTITDYDMKRLDALDQGLRFCWDPTDVV